MNKNKYIIGLRSIEQLQANKDVKIRKFFIEYKTKNKRLIDIIKYANSLNIPIESANRARLNQICNDSSHQGVIAEVSISLISTEAELRLMVEKKLGDSNSKPLLLLILERIKDPHNLGACIRTADAAGVDAVITGITDTATHSPTVTKVASGAAELIPLVAVKNIKKVLKWLGEYNIKIIGTSDQANEDIYSVNTNGSIALIMGQEHEGISKMAKSHCDNLVSIPMYGKVSSLNVSVATGVCLFEINRKKYK